MSNTQTEENAKTQAKNQSLHVDKIITFIYSIFTLTVSVIALILSADKPNKKKSRNKPFLGDLSLTTIFYIVVILLSMTLTGVSAYLLFGDTEHKNIKLLQVLHPLSLLFGILVSISIHINFTSLLMIVTITVLIFRGKFFYVGS